MHPSPPIPCPVVPSYSIPFNPIPSHIPFPAKIPLFFITIYPSPNFTHLILFFSLISIPSIRRNDTPERVQKRTCPTLKHQKKTPTPLPKSHLLPPPTPFPHTASIFLPL